MEKSRKRRVQLQHQQASDGHDAVGAAGSPDWHVLSGKPSARIRRRWSLGNAIILSHNIITSVLFNPHHGTSFYMEMWPDSILCQYSEAPIIMV